MSADGTKRAVPLALTNVEDIVLTTRHVAE